MPRKTRPRRGWQRKGLVTSAGPRDSPEQIDSIATTLEISAPQIKAKLQHELEDSAARYLGLKHDLDEEPSPAEVRDALDELDKATDSLRYQLESLDDETKFALQQAAAGTPDVIDGGIYAADQDALGRGEEAFESLVQHIYNLLDHISEVREHVPEPRRGARYKFSFTAYAWALARIFQDHTGRVATISYGEKTDRSTGGFLDFLIECVTPLENIHSRNALAKRTQRALKKRP